MASVLWPAESGAAVGMAQGEEIPRTAGVLGNRRSHVYHKPDCRVAAAMAEKNRVTLASEAETGKAGYRKARDCC